MHKKNFSVSLVKKIRQAKREHGKDDVLVAMARVEAADALREQGWYKDAERCYLDARRIAVEVEGDGSFNAGAISSSLGQLYGSIGRYDESMADL